MPNSYFFSADELVDQQHHQEAHMMDTCTIDYYTLGVPNAFGLSAEVYVPAAPIPCGWWELSSSELLDVSDVPQMNYKIRLPVMTIVTSHDRVTIQTRHGVAITPFQCEIVGPLHRGPSGLVAELRRVTE